MKKLLFLLISLVCFCPRAIFAQEGLDSLRVVYHLIRVNQGLREEETFYYGNSEEMEIENVGVAAYQGDLAFWVGEGEDLRVVGFTESGNDVNLEALIKVRIAKVKLEERVFIKPRQKLRVGLDYKVFFTQEGVEKEFQKKILYPHGKDSLQILVNTVENIGFKPSSLSFPWRKSGEEDGWFVSPRLSPEVGEIYTLKIIREEEVPGLEKETPTFEGQGEEKIPQKQDEEREPIIVAEKLRGIPEQLRVFHFRVKRWIWENILLVIVLNNGFVLALVGYKCGWFRFKFPRFPRPKPPKRRKGRKRRR